MHVSRGVFDVEMAVRKLSSRFRRPARVPRAIWPVIPATRPLIYLMQLFGLAPFEVSGDNFIPGSYSIIYSFCCTILHTYSIYFIIHQGMIRKETTLIEIIQTGKVLFNYFIAVLNIVLAVWMRKEFIGVLNIAKHFDSRIRDLGHPQKERIAVIWTWASGIVVTFIWIIVNRTGMVAFDESWLYNMAYILNYLSTSLSTVKFTSVVLLLGRRFRLLNNIAQCSKKSMTSKPIYIPVDLKVIQQLHNSLMNAGESLSSQYEWPLLLWLMNLCVHSVSNIYFLIDWFLESPGRGKPRWPRIHCQTWWLVTFISQLLLLHVTCHFTSSEANSMGQIVVNWRSLGVSRNYLMESSLHLVNRKLNFTAAGCFCVNLPLLGSIAALLTTYLVLLIQFQ